MAHESRTPKFRMPSVYCPKNENVYRTKVGYVLNKQGRRVRREFRLSDDLLIATKQAIGYAEMWLKEEQRHHKTEAVFNEMSLNAPASLPVWTGVPELDEERRTSWLGVPLEDLPGDEIAISSGTAVTPSITVMQAAQEALDRVRAKALRDAKSYATYQWYEQQFRLGLVRPAIDPNLPVARIGLHHVEQFCEHWGKLEARALETKKGSFGWQTATNRIDAFAFLLRDLKGRVGGFVYPERADAVIDESKHTVAGALTVIQAYDPDRIKAVMKRGNDRLRLIIYLAMNFGMYQSDVGQQLRRRHTQEEGGTIEIGGETYLQWDRHKLKRRLRARRREKNDEEKPVLLTHYTWPETLDLLNRFAAPEDNPYNLWLLNEDGLPLWRLEEGHKRAMDCISTAYYRATKAAGVRQPFDQYRKFGATACETIGDIKAQEMYRGERRQGSSRVYVLKDFVGTLTPVLKAWADRLRGDGVLY